MERLYAKQKKNEINQNHQNILYKQQIKNKQTKH